MLQTRQLYFVTDSAIFELFKFASRFAVQVTEALEEEGLSIVAGKFDSLRRELHVKWLVISSAGDCNIVSAVYFTNRVLMLSQSFLFACKIFI